MQKAFGLKSAPLTIEKVKASKGLENITDEEATNIIDSLRRLAVLTYKVYAERKANGDSLDLSNEIEKIKK